MRYQVIDDKTILRLHDNTYIPVDPTNRDYQLYLKEEGKTDSAPPAPAPPKAALGAEEPAAEELAFDGGAADSGAAERKGKEARPAARRLGQEWTAPDGSHWVVVQARGANGRFASDDPDTEAHENFTWAPAPVSPDRAAPGG